MLAGIPGGNDKPGGTDVRPSRPIGVSIGSSETRASTEFVASSRDGSSSSERLLAQVQSLNLNVKQNTRLRYESNTPFIYKTLGTGSCYGDRHRLPRGTTRRIGDLERIEGIAISDQGYRQT